MKILLIGKSGQIGAELKNLASNLGTLIALDRKQLDLSIPESIESAILNIQPKIIINAAAYTKVDKAEEEPGLAMAVNGTGPSLLAKAAKKVGAGLIHYSTDYVFDGCSKTPYKEEDSPNPLSVYGKSKLEGEKALAKSGITYLILRTSWVYSLRGKNFLLSIQRLSKEKESLRIVNDQIGAPTWARSIAKGTHKILGQCLNQNWPKIKDPSLSGIFHLTCKGKTSWHGFAKEIISLSGIDRNTGLHAIPTSEYPTPAIRPLYSLLSNEKIKIKFSLEMPQWEDALKDCINSK